MIDENLAAGANSAIDLKVPMPTMSDVNATVGELLQHVDDVRDATEHSPWLASAIAAIDDARQFIENHLAAFEAKAKAAVAYVESTVTTKVSDIETKAQADAGVVSAGAAAIASNGI